MYFNETKKIISICNTSIHETVSSGYALELAMAEMSCLQYALGEGFVGRVANTGSHSWISFNSLFTARSEPKLISDTILLVPVLPDGVLQLGSLQEVAEDLTVITLVKDRFNSFCNVLEKNLPCMLKRNIQARSLLSPPSCGLTENTNEPLGLFMSSLKTEELEHIGGINRIENSFSTLCQPVLSIFGGDMLPVSENDVTDNFECTGHYKVSLTEESTLLIGSMHGNRLEMVDDHITTNNLFDFPDDIGPHKELGASFQEENKEHIWDSSILLEDAFNNSGFICNRNMYILESSRFFKDSDTSYGLNDSIKGQTANPVSG